MPTPIQNPAPFVPSKAVAYADTEGNSVTVSAATPLPVNIQAAAAAPLAGTTATSAQSGPFQPVQGRPVMLALSGT